MITGEKFITFPLLSSYRDACGREEGHFERNVALKVENMKL
jgi:hypothetical protein